MRRAGSRPMILESPRRRSLRLKGFDYSQPGYFVTICTHKRQCVFGEIVEGAMVPSQAGRIIEGWWKELDCKFPSVEGLVEC